MNDIIRAMGLPNRTGSLRRSRAAVLAPQPVGTLFFRVPARDAHRVRRALSGLADCGVQCCEPHPSEKEVTLRIAFPAGRQRGLMDLLMACVPCGQFGRIAPAGTLIH